jgi:hypothetical protein
VLSLLVENQNPGSSADREEQRIWSFVAEKINNQRSEQGGTDV